MLKQYLIAPIIVLFTLTHSAIADPLDDIPDLKRDFGLKDVYELSYKECQATYDLSKLEIGSCKETLNFIFNDVGNLVEIVYTFDNGEKEVVQYIYDSDNHAIGFNKYENTKGDTNSFVSSTKIIRLTDRKKTYLEDDKDGIQISTTWNTFDSASNTLTKKTKKYGSGSFLSTEISKYNKHYQPIEFDIKENIDGRKYHDKMFYSYDKNGDISDRKKIDVINNTEKIQKFIYQYDDKGNWTQKIIYNPKKLPDERATVVKRMIIYDKNKARKVKMLDIPAIQKK